jgi:putative ABC transport system permease protein
MRFSETARLALESLYANKFRSALTMLGMIIGVFSVITLVSLGQGARNYVLKEFQSMGANFIVIQPGKTDRKSMMGPPLGSAKKKMTMADVVALERKAYTLDAVSGILLGTAQVRFEESLLNVNCFGVSEQFPKIIAIQPSIGDFFSAEDVQGGRRVAVIGSNVAKHLFDTENPLGKLIKVNGTQYRVTAVLKSMGNKLGLNIDEIIFIPVSAALRLFNEDKLLGIRAKSSSRASLDDAVNEISEILKERRNGDEDFTIITQRSMMETLDGILNMLSYVLGGIASISMLVGGVGIMNIMLVSVTERISEIGIRRAVGARRRDILYQFLVEAFVLTIFGGFLGVSAALILTHGALIFYPDFDMRPPLWAVAGAFGLSLLVGMIFGVWPARSASRIETLDALRQE